MPSKVTPNKKKPKELASSRTASPKKRANKPSVASQAIRLPGIPLLEQGTSGIHAYSGFIEAAYNRTMFWPEVYPEYNRLRRSMPEMGMVRQLFTVLSRSVSPNIELPPKPSEDDKKYQEFVQSEFDNMEGGFSQLIETMVSQVPFMGWGRWNVVPGLRSKDWRPPGDDDWQSEEDDGLIGIRRLAWRDQGTLEKWEFNKHKRMIGMWQRDFPNPSLYLPNENCMHLTFGDPNNPEGLAPLEAILRLERIRYGFEIILGIGFEHAAGYLDVTKTEGGKLTDDDVINIERAAMNVMTAKEGNFAAWPPGITASIKDVTFSASQSLLHAIQHYNILSLSIYLAQFIAFNTISGTGSYASSSDSSQIFITTFNSMMDGFAAQIDRQIGRKWWDWNQESFPGVTKRPVLKFSHAKKNVDLGVLGQFIGQIKDTIPLGEADLIAIRKHTEFLPEQLPEEDTVINPKPEPIATPFGKDGSTPPNGNGNQDTTPMMRQALEMYSHGSNGHNEPEPII